MRIPRAYVGLPSDRVTLYGGKVGCEPTQVVEFWRRNSSFQERLGISLNTHYPELAGGYYLNRAIIREVGAAIEATGCWFVLPDIARETGLVVAEAPESLQLFEAYELWGETSIVGHALLWHFGAGGGAPYGDDVVIELLGSLDRINLIRAAISRSIIAPIMR
jgi:hypothetical protein